VHEGEGGVIEIFYWTSANAQKVMMFLEETGIPFRITPTNVEKGEHYLPAFANRFPNCKIPAIIDHAPRDGGEPIPVFESGAILLYLAEKTGQFLSTDYRQRMIAVEWLFWQVGGLGPIGGQAVHFRNYAPVPIEYAIKRYGDENERLVGVLNTRLEGRDFITGDYSIADMACYPWITSHKRRNQLDLTKYPNVGRWYQSILERPATTRAYEHIARVLDKPLVSNQSQMTVEARRILFGEHAVLD
jgi:GSH-dependent disulfide-bond oxidoreductase